MLTNRNLPSIVLIGMSSFALSVSAGSAQAPNRPQEPLNSQEEREVIRERILHHRVVVPASPAQVWDTWSTAAGVTRFTTVPAKVELRPGGAYEWYFNPSAKAGEKGGEGCTVLSYLPQRMISFTWSAPPTIPKLRAQGPRSHVVVRLRPVEGGTEVSLSHVFRGEGEDWDAFHAYFGKAWNTVLEWQLTHFEKLAQQTEEATAVAPMAQKAPETWRDGAVTVRSHASPERYQEFELLLPVSKATLWRALATSEGLAETLYPQARVDLQIGGAYRDFPGSENKVLSYLPGEMLSGTGGAPDQFPEVKQGGTWWVYRLEQVSEKSTRLHMSLHGWREGEEWDRAYGYFLKNNPIYLNYLAQKLAR